MVLRAVGSVDLVVHVVRLDEENVFVDAAGADTGLVRRLGGAKPAAAGPAPTMTIDACISSRRLDGLSVVVRGAPDVRHDPDRVAAEYPLAGGVFSGKATMAKRVCKRCQRCIIPRVRS
jgi:hypothetical protein